MFPRNLALIAFYCFSISCSFGQSQVNASAPFGARDVRLLNNDPVPNGNSVWIGSFQPGFNVFAAGSNPFLLLSNWRPYGSAQITTILGQPGRFSSSSASTDPSFDNQKIWLWMFKTDNNAAPTADFANVADYGLFSSTLQNWRFPPVNSPFPSNLTTIDTSQIDQAVYGTFDSAHLYLVPEPSISGITCFLGVLALGRRLIFSRPAGIRRCRVFPR